MNYSLRDEFLDLGLICEHVRRLRVSVQIIGGIPLLDDDDRIWTISDFQRPEVLAIDESVVFKTAFFRQNSRQIFLECLQVGGPFAGLGLNLYDDLNHFISLNVEARG